MSAPTTPQNLHSIEFASNLPHLAPELWSSIFSHYLGDPEKDDYIRNILLLSSVGIHWRDILLSTPTFWNHINYAPPSPFHTRRFHNHSERIRTWLKRSGDHCPLSISLTLRSRSVPGGNPVSREIVSGSWRWESLCVKADCVRTVLKCLSLCGGLRTLRKVEVNIPFLGDDDDDTVLLISLFKTAPLLSSFHLRNVDGTILPLLTDLPLAQLRSVSLDTLYSADDVFRVLGHLSNVEELKLSLDVGSSTSTSPTSIPSPDLPITHPTLKHLSLDIAVRGDPLIISHLQNQVSTIFDNLSLPSIQTLSFTCAESHLPHQDSVYAFVGKHRGTMCEFKFVEKQTEVRKSGVTVLSITATAAMTPVIRPVTTVSGLRILEMEMRRR